MKLDATVMKTMSKEDFRMLSAVEIGMKTHSLVPCNVCVSIAKLRHGGAHKIMSSLLRDKLLSHDRSKGYDGYRLTNSGYDVLALRALSQRGIVAALGDKIGVGKESDIYIAATPDGKQVVLKFHRLGRTSFRNVRKKRDYWKGGAGRATSWLFLSRLSAMKEFAFMKALRGVDYPTPMPLGHSRHVVVMSLIRGAPLYQLKARFELSKEQAASIFSQSVALATRLAKHGLVHCDLNEFNLMVDLSGVQHKLNPTEDVGGHYVRDSGMVTRGAGSANARGHLVEGDYDGTGERVIEEKPLPCRLLENGDPEPVVTLIDFPQMISTKHPNAKELYERDVDCLITFFVRKLNCIYGGGEEEMKDGWRWEQVISADADADGEAGGEHGCGVTQAPEGRLDGDLKASGFDRDQGGGADYAGLELYYFDKSHGIQEEREDGEEDEEGEYEDEEDEEVEVEEVEEVEEDLRDHEEYEDDGGESAFRQCNDTGTAQNLESQEEEAREGSAISVQKLEVLNRGPAAASRHSSQESVKRQLKKERKKGKGGNKGKTRHNQSKLVVKGKRMHKDKINVKDCW